MDKKDQDLRIRCSKNVRRMFRIFISRNDFSSSEQGLKYLLENVSQPIQSGLKETAGIRTYSGSPTFSMR